MDTHLPGAGEPQRIVILRALQLGDSLCAVPAWRALRTAHPQAHITLIGLPWAHTFVSRFRHLVDDLLEFPGLPGFPEREPDVQAFPAFLAHIQQQEFDLALQMQGSGNLSNTLTMLLGARQAAGFYLPGQYCPDPQRFLVYPEHEPEVWRHLRLMEFLGLPLQGDALEFPLTEQDRRDFEALPEAQALQHSPYVVLHPGARAPERRWPAERFARVALALARQGLQIVITGSAQERSLAQAVQHHIAAQAGAAPRLYNLAGRTSLGALAVLLQGASLLVSNDTGASHLAAALKTPSVILFLASDPLRWAPLDRDLHRAIPRALDEPVRLVIDSALQQLYKGSRSPAAGAENSLIEAGHYHRLGDPAEGRRYAG